MGTAERNDAGDIFMAVHSCALLGGCVLHFQLILCTHTHTHINTHTHTYTHTYTHTHKDRMLLACRVEKIKYSAKHKESYS